MIMKPGHGCLAVLLCSLFAVTHALQQDSSDSSWDYFTFAQQHPSGFCYMCARSTNNKNCFIPPETTGWAIHGLWPTANGTTGPGYCDPSATFDFDSVQDLVPRLKKEWTNLLINTAFDNFWSHEYLKHGTCCTGISCLSTEYGYFSTVLDLFEQHLNYGEILDSHGIKPSNTTTYKVEQFNNAFKDALGVRPLLQCYRYSKNGGQVLTQIQLCLRKDFTVMPCAKNVFKNQSACSSSKPVRYLATWNYTSHIHVYMSI